MGAETVCFQKDIGVEVLFDTVSIKITCASDYEAQVLFDDLADRLKRGHKISIEPMGAAGSQDAAS